MLIAQHRGRLTCVAVLLSALRATTAMTTTSSVDPRLISSAAASAPTTTTTTTTTATPPTPPPPALASPGPCGISEPIHGTVEASNTGDLLKTTLVLPTRDNASTTAGAFSLPFSLPSPSDAGAGATLAADAAAARCSPPYPLVAFFSGFQSRASSYERYARHLASWGYAVVRYDTRLLSITPDNRELGWLSDVVSWALGVAPAGTLASSSSSSGPSSGPRQPDLLFTAGHSRGAKLAALQYAGSLEFARCGGEGGGGGSSGASGASGGDDETSFLPKQPLRIASAFLIDPVDNTRFTPASEAYPSAAAALRAQGSEATLAVAAAGKIGACNPLVSGYKHFWPASFGGDASFLLVFKGAGHATFNDAGRLGNKLADWLCGRGDLGREAAMSDAGAAMVSWFDGIVSKVERARSQKLENAGGCDEDGVSVSLENSNSSNGNSEESVRVLIKKRPASPAPLDAAVPSPPTAALQENFYSWARAAAAAGEVEFEVRGGLVPPQPTPQPAPCSAAAAAAAAAGSRTTAAANNVVPFPAAAAASKASAVAPP